MAVNPDRSSVPSFLLTDFISITWDLPFLCLWGCGCCYQVSHTCLGILETSGASSALPLLCVQSWLCFQGECKDLGLVKGTETSLNPLLLGRYSLLESSSLSFRKHWGLNAIYSRCIRSQMLIVLHIPEAFVLTEEINAAPDKCGSLLLCGQCTPPARGESGAVLIL